ncbi:hypothetical protein YPPY15_2907, partial [Yersinia pestis PY-15]
MRIDTQHQYQNRGDQYHHTTG